VASNSLRDLPSLANPLLVSGIPNV
jgi:hypothetical protein